MKPKHKFITIIKNVILSRKGLSSAMAVLILCTIVSALLPPLVLEQIVNRLTVREPAALRLVFLYFGTLAVSRLLEAGQNVVITLFGQKITHSLRQEMCEKLSRLPASYFTKNEPGKITSRFVNDVDAVDSLFTNGIISMFADVCQVVSILIVIFWKSRGLGILMVITTPVLLILTRLFQKRMLKAQTDNRAAVGKVTNHIPETIRNIRMIHTLFRESYMEKRYDDYIQESYRAVEKSNIYDSIYSPIIIFIKSCVIAVMMISAASSGEIRMFFGMSVGTAVAVIDYIGRVFTPLEAIGMEIQNIQSAVAGIGRIEEFLGESEEHADAPVIETTSADSSTDSREICFEHVSFGYEPERPILKDLSFEIKAGETVTFIGRTGAGKSTILRLLLGLYQPQKGQITVSGMRPENIPDKEKRSLFGYVEQSFQLLSGTVAEQISLFDDSIGQAQIEKAARLTGLHESILALEHGYDTYLTENSFSQGQMQLLSIARAIAADPQILLLDEITANLDSDTEQRVMEALENASKGRTVLSISHRIYEKTMKGKVIVIS